jgi:hypothetical protein
VDVLKIKSGVTSETPTITTPVVLEAYGGTVIIGH